MSTQIYGADPLEACAHAAIKHYEFSPQVEIELVNISENTTYRLDDPVTGNSAALRIHRPSYHSKSEIESELLWMDALRTSRIIETARPIATREGAWVTNVDIENGLNRDVVLFEWMPGAAPTTEEDLIPNFRVLGTLAARMHKHGMDWRRPKSFQRYKCDYDAAFGPKAMWGRWQNGLGIGTSEKAILERLETEIRERLERYGASPDRFGLAHNDLRLANLLIDGDRTIVIDFDDCGFSWYMYEFASAISFLEDDDRIPLWLDAWLQGYSEHREVSAADHAILPTLIMFRRLLLVGWVGLHHEYSAEAAELGREFTQITCDLADIYLSGMMNLE